MNTVATIHSAVNPNTSTYESVINWHLQKADRGEVPGVTARLRNTAISQLVSVLGEDEPKDPAWLHEHVAEIGERWARKTNANGETAKAYITRARAALADWLSWTQDPMKFKFKTQPLPSGDRAKAKEKTRQVAKRDELAPMPEATPTTPSVMAAIPSAQPLLPAAPVEPMRNFPLGQGREPLVFKLPSDGISVNDVRKMAFHLLSLAHDFDPAIPVHAQMFSVVSPRPND